MMKQSTIVCILLSQMIWAQADFKPVEESQLDTWLEGAKEKSEINANAVPNLHENHELALENLDSSNSLFNYGLSLTTVLQPGLADATVNPLSDQGHEIASEAEKAYKAAIGQYEKHGRANIMLGLLYNQTGRYMMSEPYLEIGLQLEEGSEDWMAAANQYLLAGAYTYKTKEEKYMGVYNQFKEYAHSNTSPNTPYYLKMAVLYVSYYEN